MANTYTLPGVLLSGDHASRPAAGDVASGTLYAETDTGQTFQSDGVSTWTAWGAVAGGSGGVDVTDGSTTVSGATEIDYTAGATVSDLGGGVAGVAITGGGGGGGLVLVEQHTASGSTELDFTTGITTDYDDYLIEFINLASAGGTVDLRFSSDGGSSYDTSSVYYFGHFVWSNGGSALGGSTGQVAIQLCPYSGRAMATGRINSGFVRLFDPLNTSNPQVLEGEFISPDSVTATPQRLSVTANYGPGSPVAVNAFKVFITTGTFDGIVRLYGIAKT